MSLSLSIEVLFALSLSPLVGVLTSFCSLYLCLTLSAFTCIGSVSELNNSRGQNWCRLCSYWSCLLIMYIPKCALSLCLYLSPFPFPSLLIYLSIHLSVLLCIFPAIYPSVYLPVCPSVCLSSSSSLSLSPPLSQIQFFFLHIHRFIFPFMSLFSISLSISLAFVRSISVSRCRCSPV
jgi:hypothetical protein